jgi:gliding motility-associated-like protein
MKPTYKLSLFPVVIPGIKQALKISVLACIFAMAVLPSRAATYTVTNTSNSGSGSLRQAITDANNNYGADSIKFKISGSGPYIISITSALPAIEDQVVIDGTSQSGYSGKPIIEIDGTSAGSYANGLYLSSFGFSGSANYSVIKGLVICNFNGSGIYIDASYCKVTNCYLGTDLTGKIAKPNTYGISITNFSGRDNTIGGTTTSDRNVISGNSSYGIYDGQYSGIIEGNYIGIKATGDSALGNGSGGILSEESRDNIGGATASSRNIISGNKGPGIYCTFESRPVIQGNYIGTDPSGKYAIPNTYGIQEDDGYITIGGTSSGSGNLISGNTNAGLYLNGNGYSTILSNYIGTNASGTAGIPNGIGIHMFDEYYNSIGNGDKTGTNIIAFNTGNGVQVDYNSPYNAVLGNRIFDNGKLGIDMGNDGVTVNGACSFCFQTPTLYPVITKVSYNSGKTTISGTTSGSSYYTFHLDFYSDSAGDPSGYGEGKYLLGYTDVSGGSGFNVTFPGIYHKISALCTPHDAYSLYGTSEFAKTFMVTDVGVAKIVGPANNICGDAGTQVKVIVHNYDTDTATNITVSTTCATDTAFNLTGTYTKKLAPGKEDTLTFNKKINTTSGKSVTIKVFTTMATDAVNSNDTISGSFNIYAVTVPGATSGSTSVCSGNNSGTVTLSGQTGSVVKWQSSTNGGATWSDIANTTTSQAYTNISSTTSYRAVVQSGNCISAASSATTITVNPTPTATIGSGSTICKGSTASVSVSVSNVSSTDTWKLIYSEGVTSKSLTGTGPGTFTITTGALSTTTAITLTSIQNTINSCIQSLTASATITVSPTTVGGTTSGTTNVCSGSNSGTITLSGQTGTILKWQSSIDAGSTWTDISNITASQSFTNLTNTTLYRAVVQSGVCTVANSTTSTVTVLLLPSAALNSGTTVCNGSTATISFTVSNVSSTDIWKLSYNEGATAKVIAGIGNGTFNITTANLSTNTTITLTGIQNTNTTCTQSLTSSTTVTVNPTTVGGSAAGAATVCNGSNSGTVTLSGQTGSVVKWQSSADGGTTWTDISNTAASQAYNNITVTTQYRAIVQSGVCATANSSATKITVNTLPAATISGSTTICSGTTASLKVTTSNTNGQGWSISYLEGISTKTLTGTGDGTFTLTTGTLASNTDVTLQSIVLTSGSPLCSNSSLTGVTKATVKINPLPLANMNGSQTICSGTTPAITVSISNVNSGESWSLSYNEGASAKTLSGTGPGSFTLNASALNNATGTQSSIVYTLSSISNSTTGCNNPSLSDKYTIYIDPSSVGGTLSTTAASGCYGSNTGTINLSGNTGNVVRWEYSTDGGSTWIYMNNTSKTYSFKNLTVATQYRVLVQSGVCSATYSSTQSISINPLPVATITGDNSVCSGSTSLITFTVNNVIATDNWTISYTVNGASASYTGTGTGSFNLTTPAMTYPPSSVVYKLTGIVNNTTGCSNSANGTATIQVNPHPVVSFSAADKCLGSTISFNNKSSIPAGSISGYQWTFGDGNTSNDMNPDHVYATSGSYNVKLVATSVYGCKDSITKTITVFPKPAASFTAANTCESDSADFISKSTVSPGAIASYGWDFGDGGNSSLVNPKHKFMAPGMYDVNIMVISDKGCVSSTSSRITVYALPKPSFSASAVCAYESMKFINESTSQDGQLAYNWTFEPGNTSTATMPAYRFSAAGNFDVKLLAISSFGCRDSISKTVTVNEVPKAGFTFSDVCIGKENLFSNTSTVNGGTIRNVTWDFGDSNTASGAGAVKHQYDRPGKYNVSLNVMSDKGCFDSITHQVTVHALPSAKITSAGPLNVCYGNSVTLSGPSTLKYLWNTGDKSQSVTAKKSGIYALTVTDSFGCSSKDSVMITIWPAVVINAGKDTTISLGFNAMLHAIGGNTYNWSPSADLDNPNIPDPIARPMQNTTFIVTATDINGCEGSDSVTVFVIDDHKVDTYNTISPNGDGRNDTWVIDNLGTFKGATVTIYNRYGQILYQTDDYQNNWNGTLNGKDLPEGTYYYTITFKDNDKVYKGAINIMRNE